MSTSPAQLTRKRQSERLLFLQRLLDNYDPDKVSRTMSPNETMGGDNYLWVGESAVEVIINSLAASLLTDVRTVLDLPCGHGRVLRHLVQLFPGAQFDACDLDGDGSTFCQRVFGSGVVEARAELTETVFPRKYDLIWIGSLFTHVDEDRTARWLTFLSEQLTDKGAIVATLHGRWAMRMQTLIPYTDAERWSEVERGFADGYGFVDYAPGLGHDFVPGSYGVSAVRPFRMMEIFETIPGVRLFHYQEKGWGENQDVIAFGKPVWSRRPESWPED